MSTDNPATGNARSEWAALFRKAVLQVERDWPGDEDIDKLLSIAAGFRRVVSHETPIRETQAPKTTLSEDAAWDEWHVQCKTSFVYPDDLSDLKRRFAEALGEWTDAQIEQPDTVRNVLVDGERIAHYDSYHRTWTSNSGQRVKRVRWWRELPKDPGADN